MSKDSEGVVLEEEESLKAESDNSKQLLWTYNDWG
jgi:hypothetical protein